MTEPIYSPRLRTGVVLCGGGTAGAYHAGALRALTEAGIKIDVVAAHGAGVITALATAVDGGAKVWDPAGPWTAPQLRHAYRWRPALRFGAIGLMAAGLLMLSPILVLAAAAVIYAISFGAALVNLTETAASLVAAYRRLIELLFDPPILPTILPRAVVLALLVVMIVLAVAAVQAARDEKSRRRWRGAFWWRLFGAPLDAHEPTTTMVDTLWRLVRGASNEPRPSPEDLGRRYVELLADNFGQPGFHEVIVAVHDLDSRRDLVGAVLAAPARASFEARRHEHDVREAEIVELTGPQRELLCGFLAGAMRLPVATTPAVMAFSSDSFWRGERHRVCDRPELVTRLVDEMAAVGVEQIILVSPAPPPAMPHTMRARPLDVRAKAGELLRAIETAALHDGWTAASGRFSGVFMVRPDHNPIGPFDFGVTYDESSDRHRTIPELMQQGYADAYRHFIEPVAAVGERVELEDFSPRP